MSIGQLCTRDVDLAAKEESVRQAAERMHQHAVGTLVVVDDAQSPIGIVTDRDLVERVLAQGLDPNTTTVGQVMTNAPSTVREQDPVEQAIVAMRSEGCRRLPVVDVKQRLVGLLSLDDVLQHLAREMVTVGQLLERQTPRAAAQG